MMEMAKDGTNRGGARPGAGRKPKALTEKISEGKTAEVLMEPAALEGADVPPVKDFLKSPQKSGRELVAEEVYKETFVWLKARGCDKLVTMELSVRGIKSGKVRNRKTFVYIMHEDRPVGVPSGYYVATCLEGYRSFGFDEKFLYEAIETSRRICHENGC